MDQTANESSNRHVAPIFDGGLPPLPSDKHRESTTLAPRESDGAILNIHTGTRATKGLVDEPVSEQENAEIPSEVAPPRKSTRKHRSSKQRLSEDFPASEFPSEEPPQPKSPRKHRRAKQRSTEGPAEAATPTETAIQVNDDTAAATEASTEKAPRKRDKKSRRKALEQTQADTPPAVENSSETSTAKPQKKRRHKVPPNEQLGDAPADTEAPQPALERTDSKASAIADQDQKTKHTGKKAAADPGTFANVGKLCAEFKNTIMSITLHKADLLKRDIRISHPVVKLHLVDQTTGRYVQKSDFTRRVTTGNEATTVHHILPMMTQSFPLKGDMALTPVWEEEVLFNEDYLHIVLQENVVAFFEVLDFGSQWKMANQMSDGWYRIAWGFLQLVGSTRVANTEQRVRLQLYEYPANASTGLLLRMLDPPPALRSSALRVPAFVSNLATPATYNMPQNSNVNIVPDHPGVAVPMTPQRPVPVGLQQSSYYQQLDRTATTTARVHQEPYVWRVWRWLMSGNTTRKMQLLRYPSTLHVTVKSHAPLEARAVTRRPKSAIEQETGKRTYEELVRSFEKHAIGASANSLADAGPDDGNLRLRALATVWRRAEHAHCRLPNRALHAIKPSAAGALSVAFAPSGNVLAVAAIENAPLAYPIRVYHVLTGEKLLELQGHRDVVYELEWDATRRVLADGSFALPFSVGGAASLSHTYSSAELDHSLLSTSSDGTVRVWDFTDARRVRLRGVLQHPCYVYTSKWVPAPSTDTPRLIVSGGYDCRIRLWAMPAPGESLEEVNESDGHVHRRRASIPTPAWTAETTCTRPIHVLSGHTSYVNAIVFEHDGVCAGSRFISGDGSGCIRIWSNRASPNASPVEYECVKQIQALQGIPVVHLDLHPLGRLLLVTLANNQVMSFDYRVYRFISDYRGVQVVQAGRVPMRATWSPCGTFAAASDEHGRVLVWDAETAERVAVYDGLPFTQTVHCLAFHPHDHMMALCAYGANQPLLVTVWDEQVAPIENTRRSAALAARRNVASRSSPTLASPSTEAQSESLAELFSPSEALPQLETLQKPADHPGRAVSYPILGPSQDGVSNASGEPKGTEERRSRKKKARADSKQQSTSQSYASVTETINSTLEGPVVSGGAPGDAVCVETVTIVKKTKRRSVRSHEALAAPSV